jgi:hypothetical protein
MTIQLADVQYSDWCTVNFNLRAIEAVFTLGSYVLVPACAVLRCLKLVLAYFTRRNRALRNSRNSVVLTRVQLAESMEMETGAVMLEVVLDIHDNSIAPICSKSWSWVGSVDQHHRSFAAASVGIRHCGVGNFQVVLQDC